MIRREFITMLCGATAWPVAARAQQAGRMRRIGVLVFQAADERVTQARIAAFIRRLKEFGWTDGDNVKSNIAGLLVKRTMLADTRQNWSRSLQTLSWLRAPRL